MYINTVAQLFGYLQAGSACATFDSELMEFTAWGAWVVGLGAWKGRCSGLNSCSWFMSMPVWLVWDLVKELVLDYYNNESMLCVS